MFLLISGAVFLAVLTGNVIHNRRDPANAAILFAAVVPLGLWLFAGGAEDGPPVGLPVPGPVSLPVLTAAGLAIAVVYLLAGWCAFVLYVRRFARTEPAATAAWIVVLGSALRAGRVTEMLANRLDTAADIYQWMKARADSHTDARLILTGRRKDPDSISEAAAMANYLVAKGIARDRLILEEQAATTRQNLSFVKALLDEPARQAGPASSESSGNSESSASASASASSPVIVVTNDFHVLRTARMCRRAGLRADVVGSRSPGRRPLPAVLLGEYALVLGQYVWAHALVALSITTSLFAVAAQGS